MPNAVSLIELGPGRGTLMSDVLRVFSKRENLTHDLVVYLIETSPFLRKEQCKKLCNLNEEPQLLKGYKYNGLANIRVVWLDNISNLPEREAAHFFLANEFFDALPIYKFQVQLSLKDFFINSN